MKKIVLGLLMAGAAATPAFAENADENPTIIVTGQRASSDAERRAAATPGGAAVITHQDYADKSLVSLRDTLAYTPGVYVQPRYGQEVRISIRGSGLSRGYHMRGLTLLQDGVPINLADDNGDFQELDPAFFDHLEVYRGANALRFGSGTLGGAINGVTPNGADAAGLYLRAEGGSFGTARGLIAYGGATDTADYWAAVSADTSNGDREHAHRNSLRFHGNAGFRVSDAVRTRFYASLNNINQQLPGALDLATTLTAPKTGNFTGDQARDIDSLRLQNRTTVDLGDAELNLGLFYNRKSLFHPIYQVIDQDSNDHGAYFRLDWAQGPVELTLGGEARFGEVDSERYVNVDGRKGALTFAAAQRSRTANVYAEARYHATDGLTLIAGGIYADGYRRQHQTFNNGITDVTGRADFSEFSPKFGLLYEPLGGVQVYANYSRSAEFPGFIELAQQAAFVPISAQTAWTAEIGTRGRSGIAQWDVSLYRASIDGELLQFNVGPDIPASTFNADKTRHQGLEAALTLDLMDYLRLRQVYQFSDFRFVDDAQYGDNRLPVAPKHVYRAELRIGGDALHLSPNVEWQPQGAWADYGNTLKTDGYALIGLTAGATVTHGVDVFLDARNIAGKKAVGDISAAIAATSTSVIFYPVERRSVFGGVRARF
ncbi:MAG TPA: TonB-dependent receptor [Croceibacterium sp.]|nr:TonB-dependent receptor [Croceibacterium sp.]